MGWTLEIFLFCVFFLFCLVSLVGCFEVFWEFLEEGTCAVAAKLLTSGCVLAKIVFVFVLFQCLTEKKHSEKNQKTLVPKALRLNALP